MKSAISDGTVAEEGDADMVASEQLEGITGPSGLQDAGSDDAAGAHHADFGREEVH